MEDSGDSTTRNSPPQKAEDRQLFQAEAQSYFHVEDVSLSKDCRPRGLFVLKGQGRVSRRSGNVQAGTTPVCPRRL